MTPAQSDTQAFVDREVEQEMFTNLLMFADDTRILTIQAGEGQGKSKLLEKYRQECHLRSPQIPVSLISLGQLPGISPLGLLQKIAEKLKGQAVALSSFEKAEMKRLTRDPQKIFGEEIVKAEVNLTDVNIYEARRINISRTVNEISGASSVNLWNSEVREMNQEQERAAQDISVDAFYEDLKRHCLSRPLVIIFDDFDQCQDKALTDWILQQFLATCFFDLTNRPASLLLVIAGRQVPGFSEDWPGSLVKKVVRSIDTLKPLERKHIEKYLDAQAYDYDPQDIDHYLTMVQRGLPLRVLMDAIGATHQHKSLQAARPTESGEKTNEILTMLDNLMAGNASAEDFTNHIFLFTLGQKQLADPELGEMMQTVAIAPSFDEETIGILRDSPNDQGKNTRLLTELKLLSFVMAVGDGQQYAYHPMIRGALLRNWQTPENAERYNLYRSRLMQYYDEKVNQHGRAGEFQAALAALGNMIDLAPHDLHLYVIRALIYAGLSDHRAAIADLSQVIRSVPRDDMLHFLRASSYFELNDYQSAIANYNLAIQLNGNQPEYYKSRALVRLRMNDSEDALADLDQALKLRPQSSSIRYLKAMVYLKRQEDTKALEAISKAISHRNNVAVLYLYRARIYHGMGRQQDAIADAQKCIEIDPREADGYAILYRIYRDGDSNQAALDVIDRAIAATDDGRFYHLRARLYQALGDPDQALKDLTRAIKLSADYAPNYYLRAELYLSENKLQEALVEIDHAIAIDKDITAFYMLRRRLNRNLGNNAQALLDTQHAIELDPNNGELYFALARVARSLEDNAVALDAVNKAIQLGYADASVMLFRTDIYLEVGLLPEALTDINALMKSEGEHASLYRFRARIYDAQENYDAALADIARAIELRPDNPVNYVVKRRICRDKGDNQAALDANSKAIELDPTRAALWHHRSRIYKDMGDEEAAQRDQMKARELGYTGD